MSKHQSRYLGCAQQSPKHPIQQVRRQGNQPNVYHIYPVASDSKDGYLTIPVVRPGIEDASAIVPELLIDILEAEIWHVLQTQFPKADRSPEAQAAFDKGWEQTRETFRGYRELLEQHRTFAVARNTDNDPE